MENPEEHAYLNQLCTLTQGDPGTQVSMYDIGAALGLDKSAAGTLAESLFIQDLAELKTLSGGIAITVNGLKALGKSSPSSPLNQVLSLGRNPVLNSEKKELATGLLAEIKKVLENENKSYEWMEEVVMDIKSMEVQLLSPKPKTGIVREIFNSLHQNLKQSNADAVNQKLSAVLSA
ncbi:MAG: hypothetical protein RQ739_15085 [Desulfotignum sp.]|nr:hypothetical protein [Desulfotignum sp.]